MWNQRPSLRFEIDNFSKKESAIGSQIFVGGGCEWSLSVYPKGDSLCDDHLCFFLNVANHKSLQSGWKRCANFYFVLLNQSDKELYRSSIGRGNNVFCAKNPGWGYRKTLPLSKFQEEGFLENDKLIIEIYIKVSEAFDGEDNNGFQAFASQVASVRKIISEHVVKTEYKNVLSNACNKLSELAEEGFKLDWLKSKLDEVSFKRKRTDESWIQELEERIKNLELMESGFKMESFKSKLEEIGSDESCVQKLEERVKSLEQMELWLKLDWLEEVSLERKKSDDVVGSIQQHEERIKNLEKMMSDLKVEFEKDKIKSFADGFMLVD